MGVARWPAHVAKAHPLFPKVVVVEVKERVVEEKGRKRKVMTGQPSFRLNFPLPFTIHHILIP
jgi:hypothetical protein